MPNLRLEHIGAATGLIAIVAVGLATAAADQLGEDAVLRGPAWLWWTIYLVYLAVYVVDGFVPVRWSERTALVAFGVQVLAGGVLFTLYPLGWTIVVLVVSAAQAAFTLPASGVTTLVTGQTLLIAIVLSGAGWGPGAVVLNTVVYGSFQAFAALVTLSRQREALARAQLTSTHTQLEHAHAQLANAHDELATTNAELRAATALLASTARSAERLRIARDLHDVVGHQLTALALELEVASHSQDTAAHVDRARSVARDLLGDVRDTVSELRDVPQGLEPALRELVRDLPGLRVDLNVVERTPIDDDRALTILRSIQEVVTNTLRHAGATTLDIRVVADDDGIELHARDDGRGARALVPGNGLTGLRERIEQVGGQITFDAGAHGAGFALDAHLPAS